MAAPNRKAYTFVYLLIALAVIGCAAAICGIIDRELWKFVGGYWGWSYVVIRDDCYLGWVGEPTESTSLCSFNWATAAIGGFLGLVVWFMVLCSRGRAQAKSYIFLFVLLVICWGVAGGINSANIPDANAESRSVEEQTGEDDGLKYWRDVILGLSWAAFGVSCLGLSATIMDMKSNKPVMLQQQQQQPQFYAAGGAPPPGSYPPPGAYPPPPPGTYPPPPGAYPPSNGTADGAPGYPPVGPPPPTFYPAPDVSGKPPAPTAGYPPPAQY